MLPHRPPALASASPTDSPTPRLGSGSPIRPRSGPAALTPQPSPQPTVPCPGHACLTGLPHPSGGTGGHTDSQVAGGGAQRSHHVVTAHWSLPFHENRGGGVAGSLKTTPRGRGAGEGTEGGGGARRLPRAGTHITLLLEDRRTPVPALCQATSAAARKHPKRSAPSLARGTHTGGPDMCSSRVPCPQSHTAPRRGAQCAANTRPHHWHLLQHAASLEKWITQALLAPQSSKAQDRSSVGTSAPPTR